MTESKGKLHGLDLFSGIGGITLALWPWVEPVAYCENDRYAQAVLLKNMARGLLPRAPIWDDVTTLRGTDLPVRPDILYGGFPCQDISIAGLGAGLDGKRSGLFWEIIRLCGETRPAFVFLENVPAITVRGGLAIVGAFAVRGYDCRWTTLSAQDVGANHKRARWWMLARNTHGRKQSQEREISGRTSTESSRGGNDLADTASRESGQSPEWEGRENSFRRSEEEFSPDAKSDGRPQSGTARRGRVGPKNICIGDVSDANGTGRQELDVPKFADEEGLDSGGAPSIWSASWWSVEPNVGRVAHGVPRRVDRIKSLGNAVVPVQARKAFLALLDLNWRGLND